MDMPTTSTAPITSGAPATPSAAPVATGAAPASPVSIAPTARAASQPHSANAAPASVNDTTAPSAGTLEPHSAGPANPETAKPDATSPEAASPETANPDAASGITITLPDSIPQEMIDHNMVSSYTEMAKATGLSSEQAQHAANWYVEHMQKVQEQSRAAGETQLRQLWGRDFSSNMETSRIGLATLDEFMGGDITRQLVNTGLADVPVVARLFHFFGDALNEHGMSSGTPGVGEERVMDPEEFVKNVINQSTPRQ